MFQYGYRGEEKGEGEVGMVMVNGRERRDSHWD